MPDLDLEAAHHFWYEYQDKSIYRVIAFLEGVEEGWVKDGDAELESLLKELGKSSTISEKLTCRVSDTKISLSAWWPISKLRAACASCRPSTLSTLAPPLAS